MYTEVVKARVSDGLYDDLHWIKPFHPNIGYLIVLPVRTQLVALDDVEPVSVPKIVAVRMVRHGSLLVVRY